MTPWQETGQCTIEQLVRFVALPDRPDEESTAVARMVVLEIAELGDPFAELLLDWGGLGVRPGGYRLRPFSDCADVLMARRRYETWWAGLDELQRGLERDGLPFQLLPFDVPAMPWATDRHGSSLAES
jgi:hypothetical protein